MATSSLPLRKGTIQNSAMENVYPYLLQTFPVTNAFGKTVGRSQNEKYGRTSYRYRSC